MKNSFLRRGTCSLMLLATMFLSVSCIDGYEEDKAWSPGVKNASLESPAAGDVTFAPSADGSKLKISWPVIPGAGGYEFSLYIVDDPENPVLVGEENQLVDGCAVEREMREDTYYKAEIRTLGNPAFNNKEAEQATGVAYNNLLPVTAVIPGGTDLAAYFAANPIPETTEHLCYELEAGGEYTMNGDVSIGKTQTTIRGNKVNRPSIKLKNGSFVNGGAGFILKFLDIDCTEFAGVPSSSGIILMDSNFDDALAATQSNKNYVVVPVAAPVSIQSSAIKGLQHYLFYDNGKKYAIGTLLIKDCVIGQNTSSFGNATIRFGAGMVKDMTLTNSTFYNEVVAHGSNRFCQISSGSVTSVEPKAEVWASGSMTIANCTFYQSGKGAQSFNSNGAMGLSNDKLTIQKCIFVDSFENGRIISRFRRGNTTAGYTGGENSQWYDGQLFTGSQDVTADVAYFTSDPKLTYLGNGEFKLEGAEQIAARTGDPRWLPAGE